MLNMPQRPDGQLDEECLFILKRLEAWFAVHGQAIYGTRPWKVAGEGPTQGEAGAFKENAMPWTAQDFRFTTDKDAVYAFQMKQPHDGLAVIHSLGILDAGNVRGVSLLGSTTPVEFTQFHKALTIKTGTVQVPGPVLCYRIEVDP